MPCEHVNRHCAHARYHFTGPLTWRTIVFSLGNASTNVSPTLRTCTGPLVHPLARSFPLEWLLMLASLSSVTYNAVTVFVNITSVWNVTLRTSNGVP